MIGIYGTVYRLKGKKEMKERFTTLTVNQIDETSFSAPKWDFVSKDHWDPKLDGGPYDTAKETTKDIFGVKRLGIWVQRSREGVFAYDQKEKTGVTRSTIEDDGKRPFAELRMTNKLNVIKHYEKHGTLQALF